MRLDVYLADKGICASRTEAKGFISTGEVTVNGKIITKPSFDVSDEDVICVNSKSKKYVSRGGLKLEEAINRFHVSASGRHALDVGASSGGFTDCLLQCGASHILAIDSGSGQMALSLRCDQRVTVIENYNARYMKPEDFAYVPDLAVMDVSFISSTLIMPALYSCLAPGADFICLIKPQFEVGRSGLGKGGIVKSDKLRNDAVDRVVSFASSIGFEFLGVINSPIAGGDGNIEFLAHFRKGKE